MINPPMRVLIVGCGYVGLPVGAELVRQGHSVYGVRRSSAAGAELERAGIEPVFCDITDAAALQRLPTALDWVVNTASSGGGGVEGYRRVYLQGTQNLIDHFQAHPPRKYVYTSSTGVYGQDDRSTVVESSPTEPSAETGRILVATEQLLLQAVRDRQFPAVILRVAGIYGPGRGYYFTQYLRREARIEGAGERILNMIHREDLVGVILAALARAQGGEIYNASDDEPVSQVEFYRWLAAAVGGDMPPTIDSTVGLSGRRGPGSKAVSNQKLRRALGYQFKYPTFREGYTAEIQRLRACGQLPR